MTGTTLQRLSTFVRGRCLPASRHAAILGNSLVAFDRYAQRSAPDGYPIIEGEILGRNAKLSFIPDTLELKRLPQLWLSIALRSERQFNPLVLTARPRGNDYVTLGSGSPLPHVPSPDWLPHDFEIRGRNNTPDILDHFRTPLEALFSDARVKELAFAGNHLRLLYRLAQGRRGAHLILRQPVFDGALTQKTLLTLVGSLSTLDVVLLNCEV